MRVDQGPDACAGVGGILTPDLRVAEKELLRRGEAVQLGIGQGLVRQSAHQRHVGEEDAAIIGGVLAEGQLPLSLTPSTGLKAPYSFTTHSARVSKFFASSEVHQS